LVHVRVFIRRSQEGGGFHLVVDTVFPSGAVPHLNGGRLFVSVFSHRDTPKAFSTRQQQQQQPITTTIPMLMKQWMSRIAMITSLRPRLMGPARIIIYLSGGVQELKSYRCLSFWIGFSFCLVGSTGWRSCQMSEEGFSSDASKERSQATEFNGEFCAQGSERRIGFFWLFLLSFPFCSEGSSLDVRGSISLLFFYRSVPRRAPTITASRHSFFSGFVFVFPWVFTGWIYPPFFEYLLSSKARES
jgi:hypothetical protein